MGSESYFVNGDVHGPHFMLQLNDQLRKITKRLNTIDGSTGTPTFQSNVTMSGNRLTTVADPVDPSDAVNLRTADGRYVQVASRLLDTLVNGAVPGMSMDAGTVSVTGTGTAITRLASVSYVTASLGADASINFYPGVTVAIAGNTITLSVWKPTSATDPTPIAATNAATVYWIAVGTDITGGEAVQGATSPSVPPSGGGGSLPPHGGGGGALP